MGEQEYGKCDVCGKEGSLQRTYFRYDPGHFELVCHHKECVPKEPRYTNVELKTEDSRNPVAIAMKIVTKALKEDKSPGSYYYGWQSNLACVIMDNSELKHDKANEIAVKFLELLIKE